MEQIVHKNIHEAILGIMADIGYISKDQTNQAQRFKYRGIDQVMNSLQPALIKHGVYIYPEIIDQIREERESAQGKALIYSIITVKYHFVSVTGTEIAVTVIGEGMDFGDKATNKALSVAFKYAAFQVLCIPTEEFKDPDAEVHEVKPVTKITEAMRITLQKEMERTGVTEKAVCERAKVEKIEDIPVTMFTSIMNGLKKTASKS